MENKKNRGRPSKVKIEQVNNKKDVIYCPNGCKSNNSNVIMTKRDYESLECSVCNCWIKIPSEFNKEERRKKLLEELEMLDKEE